MGRYLLAGLSVVGAVVLLLISSFSDPVAAVGNLCASLADAHVPASHPAVTTSAIYVKIASNKPGRGKAENVWDDFAREADAVMVQKLPALPVSASLHASGHPIELISTSSNEISTGKSGPMLPSRAVAHGCFRLTRTLAATTSGDTDSARGEQSRRKQSGGSATPQGLRGMRRQMKEIDCPAPGPTSSSQPIEPAQRRWRQHAKIALRPPSLPGEAAPRGIRC